MNQARRPPRERVDGILLLDKPRGLSSNDALMRARRLLNALKAGHGGTLDPMASGLLPLMFGEATKFAGDALDADKAYLAELTLGITTDTGDAEGQVRERRPAAVSEAAFRSACAAFVGPIDQVPPMHSALKREGKPLYEYARAGIELEREARRVIVHRIDVVDCALDAEPPRATVRVACSKGTYIRVLAEDIGERLGCGAHLSMLRRERVGALSLDAAIGLDALEALELAQRRARLAPVDALLAELPRVDLDASAAARFRNGQRLPAAALGEAAARALDRAAGAAPDAAPGRVRVYADTRLLGLALWRNRVLAPLRLVAIESGAEPVPDPAA
ncbi:tRNA pseudouridine(55) synthase TruB [Zeimonas arvi]|uniref:tRNA pseudouridine synthase B n=1 Tax=Zeimonas arvi TaxID=2498847 RepID=A0A5C8NPT9_9BURK|nr:tRNA pseudouridine(55) synthase TruB [Zeimonas arvi]TXL63729.1 tRNA pseudouridine(55) synthase TruB [Zeimonas arvi]